MLMIPTPHRPFQSAGHSRGVSLIEVLVALLVFSLGVLAVVALQMVSKRNNVDSAQRGQAAQLAYDLIERIRANNASDALKAYLDAAANGIGRGQQGTEPSPDCSSANPCTTDQLARHDLWLWEQQLDGVLEQTGSGTAVQNVGGLAVPTACLTADPPGGTSATYIVTIAWRSPAVLPNDVTVACGANTGLYGTSNEFRRTLAIQSYIANR